MPLILALAVLLAVAPRAVAQTNRPRSPLADSSAVRIMAHVGSYPDVPWLRDVLRQTHGPQPRPKLEELADSLADRALVHGPASVRDSTRFRVAVEALIALSVAGDLGVPDGRPYDGARDRLIRIHRQSSVPGLRSRALKMMLAVPGRPRAFACLREVATSVDPSSRDAIDVLIATANGGRWSGPRPTEEQQQATARTLHDLYERRLVVDPVAASWLEAWVLAQPQSR